MENKQLREIADLVKDLHDASEKKFSDIDKLQDRIADVETKLSRPPLDFSGAVNPFFHSEDKSKTFQSRECKTYNRFLRKGKESLGPEELKVLRVADDPRAGYLCPPELDSAIIKGINEFSPIRTVANVRSISAESLETPKKTGTGDAYWIGEIAERTEVTGFKFGMEKIPSEEMAYLMKVSLKQLEDSKFPLEEEISEEMGDGFARLEGASFVSGDGVNKPEGILVHPDVEAITSGIADNIDADSLMELIYSLKSGYAQNARFVLNRKTLHAIRILKDNEGRYVWQPGLASGQPNTILGYGYVEAVDMPDVVAGAYPVLFGDFRRGYKIVDRVPFMIQRLVEKYAEFGIIGFLGRRRVGGQVVLAEAIKKLKCAV